MKKLLLVLAVLTVLGTGLWWLARRPVGNGTLDGAAEAFKVATLPQGPGYTITFDDSSTPLRTFRWLRPTADGSVLAQVVTQTDRQEIGIFRDQKQVARFEVARPAELPEGYFRLAELQEAAVVPGDCAVLLYRNPNAPELAWVVAVDLPAGRLRWQLQLPAEHLTLSAAAKNPTVTCFGGNAPIRRLPLALQKNEQPGQARKLSPGLDLPTDLPRVVDLLSLRDGTLLAVGPLGLAVHRGESWTFHPAPPPSALGFVEPRGRLVEAGGKTYWQPEPGLLTELGPDGKPGALLTAQDFGLAGEAQELDAYLWQLLGADASGDLWFGLAAPTLKAPAAPAPVHEVPKEEGWTAEAPASAAPLPAAPALDLAAWEAHLAKGLGRIYRYTPGKGAPRRLVWAEVWPRLVLPGLPVPAGDAGLRPESGLFLAGNGRQVWLSPLSALAWSEVKAAPVKAPDAP